MARIEMSRGINQIINYFFAADVPWHFRLLVIMVIIFFLGGLYLDFTTSNISLEIPKLEARKASLAEGRTSEGTDVTQLQIEAIREHTKNKVENLASSAKLLYDFSKIALGALLASLSSIIKKGNGERTIKSTKEKPSDGKQDAEA